MGVRCAICRKEGFDIAKKTTVIKDMSTGRIKWFHVHCKIKQLEIEISKLKDELKKVKSHA